jgi:hypothetical protein
MANTLILTSDQIEMSSTNQVQADLLKRLKVFLDAQEDSLEATKVTLADTDVRLAAKTGISLTQTSAITANTAKTGISAGQTSAITANTAKVSFVGGTTTALSFGEMIITDNGRGNPDTYSIVMTAVMGALTKTVTLVLI